MRLRREVPHTLAGAYADPHGGEVVVINGHAELVPEPPPPTSVATYLDKYAQGIAGIGMLALAAGKMKESGGSLTVVAPEGRVLNLLNLTQLTSIIKVCPTVAAAAAGAL